MKISGGIHHITAITGDPQKNIDFYEGFLGQKLIKRTVNFDDPSSYHFYFGDAFGKPGCLLTFFYWPGIPKGARGAGEVSRIAYGINAKTKEFWIQRAKEWNVPCEAGTNAFGETILSLADPDGMGIELVVTKEKTTVDYWKGGKIPEEASLKGFYGATLNVVSTESMEAVLKTLGYKRKRIPTNTHGLKAAESGRVSLISLKLLIYLWPGKAGARYTTSHSVRLQMRKKLHCRRQWRKRALSQRTLSTATIFTLCIS